MWQVSASACKMEERSVSGFIELPVAQARSSSLWQEVGEKEGSDTLTGSMGLGGLLRLWRHPPPSNLRLELLQTPNTTQVARQTSRKCGSTSKQQKLRSIGHMNDTAPNWF